MKIFINDKECLAASGQSLLEVALENGFFIPSLCFNKELGQLAGCRLCVAELRGEGWSKLVASCEYPVKDGQTFYLDTDKVVKSRKMSASLLLARAPESKEILEKVLKEEVEPRFVPRKTHLKNCLLCGRCYRTCQKQGTGAISIVGRGAEQSVETPYVVQNEDCIACLACANACPTGAIEVFRSKNQVGIWHKTHDLVACPVCGFKHITQKAIDFLSKKSNIPAQELALCPDCRNEKTSKALLKGFSQ